MSDHTSLGESWRVTVSTHVMRMKFLSPPPRLTSIEPRPKLARPVQEEFRANERQTSVAQELEFFSEQS